MNDENKPSTEDCREKRSKRRDSETGVAGWVFFAAFIGAAVYFIQQATTFGAGVLGFLKAIVWPYFLIYNLLDFLNA